MLTSKLLCENDQVQPKYVEQFNSNTVILVVFKTKESEYTFYKPVRFKHIDIFYFYWSVNKQSTRN
jgi:hypothetical protein